MDDDQDCDDEDPNVFPGAVEVCDSVDADEDCDGDSDEDDEDVQLTTFFADDDGDGYGDAGSTSQACDLPGGYVENDSDCDDRERTVNPDGTEVCDDDGLDEDCDGKVNDDDSSMSSSGLSRFYADNDGDGYGDGASVSACDPGDGYASRDGDCDDDERNANPGETEECNDGIDNDCDGDDNGCGFSGTFTASSADIIVEGAAAGDYVANVAPAGDQDGDGTDDFVVGAAGDGSLGAAFLFYGGVSGRVDTGSADVKITGASGGSMGWAAAGGFDWNDDGDPDFAVGDPYRSSGGTTNGGSLFTFFGPVTSDMAATAADRIVSGSTYGYVGFYVQGADWDGDGTDDLVYESGIALEALRECDRGRCLEFFRRLASAAPAWVDPWSPVFRFLDPPAGEL